MVKLPEKRDAVLYVRIQPSLKKFVYRQSVIADVTESKWINSLLANEKEKEDRKNARKSTKSRTSKRRSR